MKSNRTATGLRLTNAALAKIDSAGERLGRSRAAIVEILAMMHADKLDEHSMIPASALPADSRLSRKKRKIVENNA